jgi:acyl-CoA thioesterase-1
MPSASVHARVLRTLLLYALALLGSTVWATTQAPSEGSGPKTNPTVLVVGDSLSAEYGLTRGKGWVALLEQRLKTHPLKPRVINASISGDTTAGGRSRLPALLAQHRPQLVVIELGGNDALRGLPLDSSRANLKLMIQASRKAQAQVILLGMQVPPNYGRRYTEDFARLYSDLAREEAVPLLPFFLKDVADGPRAQELFQADRIHPNEAAHPIMLENVWPLLQGQLKLMSKSQ